MRCDSAVKRNGKVEYGWRSDFHTAANAAAVKDLCSVRSSCVLGAMIALGLVAWPQPAEAESPPEPIKAVVAKVKPAVVEVVVVRPKDDDEDKPDQQMAKAEAASRRRATAIGSGFLIEPSGYIATNKHLIQEAVAVFVATPDGIRYKARIVGMAGKADMALLKIDTDRKLPTVPFGDSNAVEVGDTVIAVGSPFGFDDSVTAGIVSAVDRDIMESPFDDYIQTDPPSNHGSPGRPL